MQYASLLLVVFFVGIVFSQEDWNLGKFEDVDGGEDEYLDLHRYITNKRAINGQLRRSSIRWGKRTTKNADDQVDVPFLTPDVMSLWPAPAQVLTVPEKTATEAPKGNQEARKLAENGIMERVAKGGIRPKLALSSRLWGR
ncbi:unnamed protein product [Caenorhabditis sp. 36 PRJEB53466]|nr:unnamed protein product [Caenorhabditis sp. 36 PRJEB53466]